VVRTSNALALMRTLGLWRDGPAAPAEGTEARRDGHRHESEH
jgi:hypothetical protein